MSTEPAERRTLVVAIGLVIFDRKAWRARAPSATSVYEAQPEAQPQTQ